MLVDASVLLSPFELLIGAGRERVDRSPRTFSLPPDFLLVSHDFVAQQGLRSGIALRLLLLIPSACESGAKSGSEIELGERGSKPQTHCDRSAGGLTVCAKVSCMMWTIIRVSRGPCKAKRATYEPLQALDVLARRLVVQHVRYIVAEDLLPTTTLMYTDLKVRKQIGAVRRARRRPRRRFLGSPTGWEG